MSVDEGASATYTLELGAQPSGRVIVTVSGHVGTDVSVGGTPLTFTAATWAVAQTVTVTAAEDDTDIADDVVTLMHGATGGGYGDASADLVVTVADDDAVLVIEPSPLSVPEGGTAMYTVALAAAPSREVTVTVSGDAGSDVSVGGAPLTFSAATWAVAQTVTVTAADDPDAVHDVVRLTHAADGGGYGDASADLTVTVADDDAGLVFDPSALSVPEGGTATYTVALAALPAGDVAVTVGGHLGTDVSVSGAPLTLMFSTATWAVAQTVTVTAAEDDADAVDDVVTLTHAATGGDYDVSAGLEVTVADDDAALVISPSPLRVDEGDSATYTVKLAALPSGEVTVTITGQAGSEVSVSGASLPLTFTPADWAVAQMVTVTAVGDGDAAHDVVTLTHAATGGGYGDVSQDLEVTVADDDAALVIFPSPLRVDEGTSATYTVELLAEPAGDVTVEISGHDNSDVSLGATTLTLTFSAATWETAQTVTVTAAHDGDAANDNVTLTHAAAGGDYAVSAVLAVIVADDDAGLVIDPPSALSVPEGETATYTVALAALPAGDVTVEVSGHSGTDVSVGATTLTLTFSTATWATAQTVTVTAAEDDANAVDDVVTLTHAATGGDYDVSADLTVTVADDDAGLVIDPSALSVPEGASAMYTVKLAALPSADVTVTVSGDVGTDVSVSDAPLTLMFSTATWAVAQTVTVTAAEDADIADDVVTLMHAATGGGYGVTQDLVVTVADDDAVLVIEPSPLSVPEGGTAMYTVALAALPSGEVTVTVSGDVGSDVSVGGAPLMFSAATWAVAQTVTVTAADDPDAVHDVVRLTHAADGGGYGDAVGGFDGDGGG